MLGDERHAGLGDAGLLGSDAAEALAEEALMVEPQLRDAADDRGGDDIGRIEPAAEPDLDDADIRRDAGEGEEGGGGGDLEEAGADAFGDVEHLGEQFGQRRIVDQGAGEADALVEADQVRAGVDMRLEAGGLGGGADERASRSLAVGAGDMDHRWQLQLGMAESVHEDRDPLQAEDIGAGRQRGEPLQLALTAGSSERAKSGIAISSLSLSDGEGGPCGAWWRDLADAEYPSTSLRLVPLPTNRGEEMGHAASLLGWR